MGVSGCMLDAPSRRRDGPMFSWLAKAMLERNMARLREGDYRSVSEDGRQGHSVPLPGRQLVGDGDRQPRRPRALAAALCGRRPQARRRRDHRSGAALEHDARVRGTSHLDTEDGRVYENRYVMWGRVAWGLLREYEVYEDTQASKALDEYLSQRESIPLAPTRSSSQALRTSPNPSTIPTSPVQAPGEGPSTVTYSISGSARLDRAEVAPFPVGVDRAHEVEVGGIRHGASPSEVRPSSASSRSLLIREEPAGAQRGRRGCGRASHPGRVCPTSSPLTLPRPVKRWSTSTRS